MADLTVMTWNIQNLFPVGHEDGPATQGRGPGWGHRCRRA
jgi:hypothetical protein